VSDMHELMEVHPAEAVQLGATELTLFGKLFFPRTFRQDSPLFHRQIGAALYSQQRFNAFEVFRGGAKTTLLRTYAAQRISYAISRTIMYTSVSQMHAAMSLRWVRRQVQYNGKWAQTFGLRKGDKWTDEWLEIYHGVDETPITMLAMGITGQIRGFNPDDFRPDLIIVDDVLNEENTATPDQRKKIEDLLFGALMNSLAPATEAPLAKGVFINTPFNKNDAIEKCLQDPEWHGFRYGCFDEKGESIWPARYPTKTLKESKESHIRRGQYSLWMREWECKIVSSIDKAFDTRRLQYWQVLPEYMDVVIGIDPASSDSDKADDHVIVSVGFRGLDCFVLAYHVDKKVMPDAAAHHFFELSMMYPPIRAAVESIAYQRILAWYLETEMQRRRQFVAVDRVQDKRKKANRIMQCLMHYVAYGHLWIHPSMSELLTQMDDYDPQVEDQPDDILDAIAIAIVSYNPQLRAGSYIDGEAMTVPDDDSQYGKPLRLVGVP